MIRMTAIWEKLEAAKNAETLSVARQMADYMNAISETNKELEEILNVLDDVIDYDQMKELEASVSKYRSITLSNVNDKATFEQIVIALTERYSEGRKSEGWDKSVIYTWDSDSNHYNRNITVSLTVKVSVTGCTITKEKVYVPEKVVPAHEEEKTVIKCEQ